jgi:hypothetical protein
MTEQQAQRQAAKASKTEGPQFVVWVFDQGRDIFGAEQMRRYAPFVQVEAVFLGGVQVAAEAVAL